MKLLFLACLSPKTGNHTTAERIRSHIESAGHTCELRDAAEFQSPAEVANLISSNPTFEGALAIHLFKAGRLLLDIQVPFGVIFGGTDINEDVKVEQKRVVMEQVLQKARFAVAFTDKLKEEAELYLLSQSSRIYVQPQGIQTEVSEKFCWSEFLRSSDASIEHVDELRVFLLVCGLRRVKDPLYLVEVFSEWHYENPLNVLVIIGPKIDPLFTVEVEAVVKSFSPRAFSTTKLCGRKLPSLVRSSPGLSVHVPYSAAVFPALSLSLPFSIIHASVSPESRRTELCRCFCRAAGVFLAQERSQQELHAAMKRCFAVVNSSVSEGMSAAILEAMDLGVPVLARDIPGNAAVVQHEFTGLLYSSPQEFVHQSHRLLSDHELRERVVRNGKLYVEEHHGLNQERETYRRLVDTLL
ncbi:glycosyltransferase 1 domain-containing protein 1 isoform X2 [Gymnodraco acuticeps]|uniref:Glycosyltransferase 1 domain-containing protein 1 isoform X2 n=1 Tax=Gymnodraco acuticeps TaxID=8218 RepID=A0A6P8TWF9_GYMAC|nr:glycosyltransferase 1 domain-containing protein 1 isoform X2 [Gymnodraco acuticeps]